MNFLQLDLPHFLQDYLSEEGFKKATPVQVKVIKAYQEDKALLALAPTASGKTLAFALPIIEALKIYEKEGKIKEEQNSPFAVIITPTRELGQQVLGVFKKISHHAKFRARFIGGSNSKLAQRRNESFEILVSTPQTISNLIKLKKLSLKNLRYFVIDEVDQVLDPGFKNEISYISNKVDFKDTHIGLFSATYPPLLDEWLDVYFKGVELQKILIKGNVKQGTLIKTFNLKVPSQDRLITLKPFIKKSLKGRGIIFCSQKNQVGLILEFLNVEFPKLKVTHVHGDLPGADRKKNLKKFAESKVQILVASDIAARGIDIVDLDWIFNYTLPKTAIYYLHRVGRLSRDGRPGLVYNIVGDRDEKVVKAINEAIKREGHLAIQSLPNLNAKTSTQRHKKPKKKPGKITKRTRL